jgi:hypothetical protein
MTRMRWTPERDAKLTRLWADGMQGRDIGEALGGCSEDAVRARAEKLRLPRRKAPDWTADQDAALLRMRREKLPFAQIAETLGRTLAGCRVRHQTLTMRKAVKPSSETPPPMQRVNEHVGPAVIRYTGRAAIAVRSGTPMEQAIREAEAASGGIVKLDPAKVRAAVEAAS